MYGKLFSSLFEGSMVGAGPTVFAVWAYCIAKADTDGTVLLNPDLLAPIIGTSKAEINTAIKYLTSPDRHSKNPEHDGRRVLHQSGHQYFLVSHKVYREIKNNEDRREYMREYMRQRRESEKANQEDVNINKTNKELTKVNPASASASASLEGESEGGTTPPKEPYTHEFQAFYEAYPVHKGKDAAFKKFLTAKKRVGLDCIMAGVERLNRAIADGMQDRQFVKHPASWLNQGCWDDEYKGGSIQSTKRSDLPSTWHSKNPDKTMRNAF